MKWNRQTIQVVVIVFVTIAFSSFVVKFAMDHDGETITIGGPDPTSAVGPSEAGGAGSVVETGEQDPESGLPWVREEDLPVLAQGTLALIDQGGPFPFERDGVVFENREGILPDRDRGYYHEYTVVEPGADDRGPQRIVTGEGGDLYWTEDHYGSFDRVLRRDL